MVSLRLLGIGVMSSVPGFFVFGLGATFAFEQNCGRPQVSTRVFLCLIRLPMQENFFSQLRQAYGMMPVWIELCVTRLSRWANALPQALHWNGFSLVCCKREREMGERGPCQ